MYLRMKQKNLELEKGLNGSQSIGVFPNSIQRKGHNTSDSLHSSEVRTLGTFELEVPSSYFQFRSLYDYRVPDDSHLIFQGDREKACREKFIVSLMFYFILSAFMSHMLNFILIHTSKRQLL